METILKIGSLSPEAACLTKTFGFVLVFLMRLTTGEELHMSVKQLRIQQHHQLDLFFRMRF